METKNKSPKKAVKKETEKPTEPKKRMSKTWEAMMLYKGGMTINDPAWLLK